MKPTAQRNTLTATREGGRKGLSRVTGQTVKKSAPANANKAVSGQVASLKGDIRGSRGLRVSGPKDGVMGGKQESGMKLSEINQKVDALVAGIRRNNKELQPLVYQAWKLFGGRKGTPAEGEQSFSGWLNERSIPRRTGYNIVNRELTARGEVNVPVAHSESTAEDEEFCLEDSQEGTVDDQEGTVEVSAEPDGASASTPDKRVLRAPAKSVYNPEPVSLKARTDEYYQERRTFLEQKFREDVGETKATKVLNKAIVDWLEANGGRFQDKTNVKKIRKENEAFIAGLKAQTELQKGGK